MNTNSEPKYEILSSSEHVMFVNGKIMQRIRALRDIPRHNVLAGDLGGWVQNTVNLSQTGDCWIKDGAMARDGSQVCDNALLCEYAVIRNMARLRKNCHVGGYSVVHASATITDSSFILGLSKIGGSITIAGNSRITGSSVVSGGVNALACLCDVYLTDDAYIEEARDYCRMENVDRNGTVIAGFRTVTGELRFQLYRNKEQRDEVKSLLEGDFSNSGLNRHQRVVFEFIKKHLSRK